MKRSISWKCCFLVTWELSTYLLAVKLHLTDIILKVFNGSCVYQLYTTMEKYYKHYRDLKTILHKLKPQSPWNNIPSNSNKAFQNTRTNIECTWSPVTCTKERTCNPLLHVIHTIHACSTQATHNLIKLALYVSRLPKVYDTADKSTQSWIDNGWINRYTHLLH